MTCEFEVMVLQIGEAVRHDFFARLDRLLPKWRAAAFDADLAGHRAKRGADDQFRTDAALAKLGARKVQIVTPFEKVIGEFISCAHADAVRRAIVCDRSEEHTSEL